MKKFITIIVLLLTALVSYAGEFANPESNSKNIGSTKSIGGKTVIFVMYTSYVGENNVSDATKKRFVSALNKAASWIEGNALKYGVNERIVYNVNANDLKVSKNIDITEITPVQACKLYFGDNYQSKLKSLLGDENCDYLIMVCTEKEGLCSSWCGNTLEGCVINMGNKGRDYPCSIAHELLHCYGAWDLYEYGDVKLYKKEDGTYPYRDKLYNSVMMYNDRIDNVVMDELTAYLVGLTNKTEWWFYQLSKNGAR